VRERVFAAETVGTRVALSPPSSVDDLATTLTCAVIELAAAAEQALITTADLDRFSGLFLTRTTIFSVAGGTVEPLSGDAGGDAPTAD
jgi:hypothetical protein